MSNIAGSSVYSSANTSTSTLRPRNNRLISYLDDTPADNDVSSRSASTATSRAESPSPSTRKWNLVSPTERSTRQTQNRTTNDTVGRRSSSLWDSWSSIQGAASSFLAGESSSSVGRKGSIKTPAWMKQDSKFSTAPATPKWGPQTKDSTIPQPGSIEERQALVQAKRREALLLSCAQDGRDDLGNFKRKASSDADVNTTPYNAPIDSDALVYKHRVQPRDTMAGVTIKYGCQPETFRKVNRFWPNDNIQTRTHVLLPVEACSVHGRKVDDATNLELLTDQLNKVELDSKQRVASADVRQNVSSGQPSAIASPRSIIPGDEAEYKHDSFVMLPSFAEPIEILRIPRRALGYFPRTRRKSVHYNNDSVSSTPKSSFDMLRHPPTHAAQQAAAALTSSSQQSLSLNASPVRRPGLNSSRQRSSSTTATTHANSNAWILRGPGGVGTLSGLRTEVSRPGPGEDPLNQKFAHYFPTLAIQNEAEETASNNSLLPRSRTNTMSRSPYRGTPRASVDSIRSTRSNSSTFGAGVTGVMRKLASTGKRPDTGPRSSSGNLINAMSIPVGGETGLGDLIELETNPDALHHDLTPKASMRKERKDYYEEDGERTPIDVGRSQEDLLNERFPVRGRITRAYGGDKG